MMGINAFLFLIIGYTLVRKLKSFGIWITRLIWAAVVIEIITQLAHYYDSNWYLASEFVASQKPFPTNVFVDEGLYLPWDVFYHHPTE